MSIRNAIQGLCQAGDLQLLVPSIPSFSVKRDVFLSGSVRDFLDAAPGVDRAYHRQGGRALSLLDRFSTGSYMTFGMDPYDKKASSILARIAPVGLGIVDVRVTDPRPMVRLFGGFAATDVLVLLNWAPRDGLDFSAQAALTRAHWNALMGNHAPIVGTKVEDYVSKHFHIG